MTIKEVKKQVELTTPSGGSLNGYVKISYDTLIDLFGEPNCDNDGYKTDAEWAVEFQDETFAIYNYKTGKNYLGSDGLNVEDITDWHIGGNSRLVAAELIELLESIE